MKRDPDKLKAWRRRSAPLGSKTQLKAKKPINPVNRKRRAAELLRTYGPPERRAWTKEQPCEVCGAEPSDNAHIEREGMSRKAHYALIIPLCAKHHNKGNYGLDVLGRARFEAYFKIDLEQLASQHEQRWLTYSGKKFTHLLHDPD